MLIILFVDNDGAVRCGYISTIVLNDRITIATGVILPSLEQQNIYPSSYLSNSNYDRQLLFHFIIKLLINLIAHSSAAEQVPVATPTGLNAHTEFFLRFCQ